MCSTTSFVNYQKVESEEKDEARRASIRCTRREYPHGRKWNLHSAKASAIHGEAIAWQNGKSRLEKIDGQMIEEMDFNKYLYLSSTAIYISLKLYLRQY